MWARLSSLWTEGECWLPGWIQSSYVQVTIREIMPSDSEREVRFRGDCRRPWYICPVCAFWRWWGRARGAQGKEG
jgi:hypothetical protein